MSWRIIEWSRELGRGRIEGTHAEPLDFDASVALVDDFRIGEEVYVELERSGDTWLVTKITPDDPRFVAQQHVATGAPALEDALAQTVQAVLDRIRLQEIYRPAAIEGDTLILRGEEGYLYPPPSDEVILGGLRYAEVANPIEIKSFRLARAAERDYLATRVEDFCSTDIALTLVDACNRFYFLVCASVAYKPGQ